MTDEELAEATPGPQVNAEMLRRAAQACRNAQKQMTGQTGWFDWVPEHLVQVAAEVERAARIGGPQATPTDRGEG